MEFKLLKFSLNEIDRNRNVLGYTPPRNDTPESILNNYQYWMPVIPTYLEFLKICAMLRNPCYMEKIKGIRRINGYIDEANRYESGMPKIAENLLKRKCAWVHLFDQEESDLLCGLLTSGQSEQMDNAIKRIHRARSRQLVGAVA